MTIQGWTMIALFAAIVIGLAKPVGAWLFALYEGRRTPLHAALGPVERGFYRLSGIDPDTKNFSDPKAAIQKEIAEVNADKEMSPDEKKQALGELNEALKSAEPVKYPGNIELVKKYYNDLDANAQ